MIQENQVYFPASQKPLIPGQVLTWSVLFRDMRCVNFQSCDWSAVNSTLILLAVAEFLFISGPGLTK